MFERWRKSKDKPVQKTEILSNFENFINRVKERHNEILDHKLNKNSPLGLVMTAPNDIRSRFPYEKHLYHKKKQINDTRVENRSCSREIISKKVWGNRSTYEAVIVKLLLDDEIIEHDSLCDALKEEVGEDFTKTTFNKAFERIAIMNYTLIQATISYGGELGDFYNNLEDD